MYTCMCGVCVPVDVDRCVYVDVGVFSLYMVCVCVSVCVSMCVSMCVCGCLYVCICGCRCV